MKLNIKRPRLSKQIELITCCHWIIRINGSVPAKRKTWIDVEVEILPLVEPDIGESCVVMVYYFGSAARKCVWRGLAEYMANVRAR